MNEVTECEDKKQDLPKSGSLWSHYGGNFYMVISDGKIIHLEDGSIQSRIRDKDLPTHSSWQQVSCVTLRSKPE